MTTLSTALSVLGVLCGLLVIAAAALALFRANYAKATIDTLRDSNTALTDRVKELEADNTRILAQNESQATELRYLRTYVSGTEAVKALERKVEEHQRDLVTHRRALVATLERIERKLGNAA